MCVPRSLFLILWGVCPGVELQDHYMFNILKHGIRSILYSHQRYKRVPVSLRPHHYLLFYGFIFLFLFIFFYSSHFHRC